MIAPKKAKRLPMIAPKKAKKLPMLSLKKAAKKIVKSPRIAPKKIVKSSQIVTKKVITQPLVATCEATDPKTDVHILAKGEDEQHPNVPAFVSKVTGTIEGTKIAQYSKFKIFLKEECAGRGYHFWTIEVPDKRESIDFQSSLMENIDEVMNSGNPKWLEIRANDDPNILVCCQFATQ